MNPYIGHDSQLYGIEEFRLVGGKGDGMRLYEINNGKGMMLTVSPDRNGDITRLRYKGMNLSYFSPCGYVAPAYYDNSKPGLLRQQPPGFCNGQVSDMRRDSYTSRRYSFCFFQ